MPDPQTSSIWTSSTCRLQPYSTQTSSTRTSSTQTSSTWTSSTPARERATDNFRQVLIQMSSHLLKRSLSFKLTDDLSNNCSLPPSKINQKSKSKTNQTKPVGAVLQFLQCFNQWEKPFLTQNTVAHKLTHTMLHVTFFSCPEQLNRLPCHSLTH